MGISFRKDKMTKGRLDNADVEFSATAWDTKASTNGNDLIWLTTTFIDADGAEHPQRWMLTQSGERVIVNNDGALEDVDPNTPFRPSMNSGVGKLMASLEDLGVSPKTLDLIATDPSVLDGLKVHVEQRGSGRKNPADGREYTDLIVTEIHEGKAKGKSAGAASKPAGKPKPAHVADDSDTDSADDVDPVTQATRDTLLKILSDPDTYVKNYDDTAGGITPMQANKGAFAASDAPAKDKGKIAAMIKEPEFLAAGHADKLWKWDDDEGLISPRKRK